MLGLTLAILMKLNVIIVVAQGPRNTGINPSSPQFQQVLSIAKQKWAEAGYDAKFNVLVIKDPCSRYDTLGGQNYYFQCMKDWVNKNHLKQPRNQVLVLREPVCNADRTNCNYFLGLANVCTYRRRTGMAMAVGAASTPYGDRIEWTAGGINHEGGHANGAYHIANCSVMDTALYGCIRDTIKSYSPIHFDPFSIGQMRDCRLSAPAKKRMRLLKYGKPQL